MGRHVLKGNRTNTAAVREVTRDLRQGFQIGPSVLADEIRVVSEDVVEFLSAVFRKFGNVFL